MSKQQNQITTLAMPISGTPQDSETGNLFKKYLFHWPLFLLGIILFTLLAYLYLKVAPSTYPISATIEFKALTATSASLTVNQNSAESQLNPIDKPVIVENEIEVMQSKKIVYKVVNELQLWANYSQKKGLIKKDLYSQTPVKFQFIKQFGVIDPSGVKIKIKVLNKNSFSYSDDNGESKTEKFSTPIKSGIGTWQLIPTQTVDSFVDSALLITINDPDLVSDAYQKNIKVELENKDAPFVNLTTSDDVPERGKDVLNAVMSHYLQFALEDKNRLSEKTLKFIDDRLDSLQNDLNSIEKQIEDYKSSHHITWSVDTEAVSYQNIRLENLKSLNDVDVQLGILNNLEKYAESTEGSERLPVSSTNLGDASLSSMYDKLSDMQIKRGQLIATLPETSPMVLDANNQIKILKGNFIEKLESLKSSLLAQKHQLQSIVNGVQSYLNSVPTMDKQLNVLKRVQQSKDKIYKFLLEKREQVGLRYASSVSDSEIVDDAHAGKIKWPIVPVVYLIGMILGFGAAAGLLYLRESLNDLITNRSQIEEETGVPILGELGYQNTEQQIVVSAGRSKFSIGEQFRVLRTNLYHLHGNNETGRVTLFTSSVSGEGKSFVSSNLAVALAYASRKTVILEMDLRKPKVSVNFGLSSDHIGISNYLNGETKDIAKIVQPSGIPGLDVLGCGPVLPNPSELLEQGLLDELINSLKGMYDEIIIDSPPIHLVTDALIIARVADTSLYVVRQGYTHKYELEFIKDINDAKRFPKFRIIFNGVKSGTSSYGGYGYGYGYGYSSSYNAYATKEKVTFVEWVKKALMRF